ncbi:MAG TPA: hypothetical protein VF271_03675 [Rhodanobacteraceae bacterium]
MSLSYARLRQLHFLQGAADRFQGLGRTAITVVAFLGVLGVLAIAGMVVVLANGLMALASAQTAPVERLGVVLGWQLVTLGLLWSLRRLIFMREADSFLSILPIPKRAVWHADVLIALQCYSVLWLPLAWVLCMLWSRQPPMQALVACVSYLVMIGTGLVLNVLLLRGAYRHAAIMALPLLVLVLIEPQSTSGAVALLGVTVLTAAMAISMRPRRLSTGPITGHRRAFDERLAIASALVLPVSANVLRDSLVVRGACLFGAWALALMLLAGHAPGVDLATALLIGLTAVASAVLYRLPMMIRDTVLDRLDFLAGHHRFRWRVTALAAGLPAALFVVCLCVSWVIASHALPDGTSASVLPSCTLYIYAALFVLGALAASWPHKVMRWLTPIAHFAITLILLMVTLT